MNIAKEAIAAERRIRPYVRKTMLDYSLFYSERVGANVHFKLENLQYTGSFKVRGAMNKLLSLTDDDRKRGVVTASTGNHGAAVAFSLGKLGASGIVFVPENASQTKVQAVKRLGAEVRYFGEDTAVTEAHARQYAAESGLVYVPPYNDLQVVAGQGTVAIELAKELDQFDAVFVALGGGGLISGIAGYLKSIHPGVQIFGCSPQNSQVMIQSVKAGEILDLPSLPTISDGTAGGIEPGSMTFDWCRQLVDEYVTVTEDEIKDSLREFLQMQHMLIEGAAAVPVAACLKQGDRLAGKHVVIIICGANISLETLKAII